LKKLPDLLPEERDELEEELDDELDDNDSAMQTLRTYAKDATGVSLFLLVIS
jgi:hypothetical protein